MSEQELIAGRYRKRGTIGVGGMARVVLADDERLRREVAIKTLHADSPQDSARRFEREALMGASLNHPNLVSVYDIVTDEESVLIVMEYVEGRTLKEAIADDSLDPETAAGVITDIAAGLDHAHGAGIVHRDVKPANILIRADGLAKLADLGIATAAEATNLTRSGIVLGTAVYMAPEQLEGERAGPPADIYSLAAVAYEALSGQKAREGGTPVEIAHKVATRPPPDLLDAWPDAPPAAGRALCRGMDRAPEARPRSAGELARELNAAIGEPAAHADDTDRTVPMERTAVAARPVPPAPMPARTPPPVRAQSPQRTPSAHRGGGLPSWLPAAAGLVALALVVAVLASTGGGDDSGTQAGSGSTKAADRGKKKEEKAAKPADQTQAAPAPADEAEEPEPSSEEPVDAVAIDPEEGARLDAQAFDLIKQGKYAEAVPIARQAVASFPEDSQTSNYAFALFNLGTALNRSGSPDEAIPFLEKRLSFSDDRPEVVQSELDDARANAGG